ncbi:MAG: hypothetical protein AB7U82_34825 [Blastocatellales bacterium]
MNKDTKVNLRLCCRLYDTGKLLGYVSGLDAGVMSMSCRSNDWSPRLAFDYNHFIIEGESFLMLNREHFADQSEFEQITTTAGELARLLNWARSNEAFAIDTAPVSIWQVWRAGQPFAASHLKCLFD